MRYRHDAMNHTAELLLRERGEWLRGHHKLFSPKTNQGADYNVEKLS